nr:hypothetical protein [Tanacetum cinerariifolium]GFC82595.1 hypothetical protein [Tanacetum cinerariifolium]
IPILDIGKFEQWQFWIQQYLQHEHYALWEVIEFGDSYEVPASTASATITDTTSGETAKHSSGNEDGNSASVSTTSTNVPTAFANIGVDSISQDTACAYIASQSSGSHIKFKDINQIDEDDMEEMDIK